MKYPGKIPGQDWVWYRELQRFQIDDHRKKMKRQYPEYVYGYYKTERGPEEIEIHEDCKGMKEATTPCSHGIDAKRCNLCRRQNEIQTRYE